MWHVPDSDIEAYAWAYGHLNYCKQHFLSQNVTVVHSVYHGGFQYNNFLIISLLMYQLCAESVSAACGVPDFNIKAYHVQAYGHLYYCKHFFFFLVTKCDCGSCSVSWLLPISPTIFLPIISLLMFHVM